MTFVDLDTVSRDELWQIKARFGCAPRSIAMVQQFHDGTQARVQNDEEFSEVAIPGGPQGEVFLNFLLQDSLRYSVS